MTGPTPPGPIGNLQVNQADAHTTAIINAITAELTRNGISDFSVQAAAEFLSQSGEVSRSLGIDAIRLARADNADYVSEKHVRRAGERLVPTRQSRLPEVLLAVGGIVAGAALQLALDKVALSDSNPSKGEVGWIFLLALPGIALLVAGFYKKRS